MAPKAKSKPKAKAKAKVKSKAKAKANATSKAVTKTKGKAVAKRCKAAPATENPDAVQQAGSGGAEEAAQEPARSAAVPPAHIRQFERGVLEAQPKTDEERELKEAALKIKAMRPGSGKQELYRELVRGFREGGAAHALQRLSVREQVTQTKQCSEEAVSVPLALMVGQCGGNVELFQEALRKGDVVEVVDPKRPGAKLYQWRQYKSLEATALNRSAEKEGTGQGTDEGTGEDSVPDFSLFDVLDVDFALAVTGVTSVDLPGAVKQSTQHPASAVKGSSSSGSSGSGQPLALADASAETKVWLKVSEAARVAPGMIFKAKQAVRRLGKSTVARASGALLEKLIGEAEVSLARLQEMSLEHSGGDMCAQVDLAGVQADLRDFHAVLAELQQGEKSAVALRDKDKQ